MESTLEMVTRDLTRCFAKMAMGALVALELGCGKTPESIRNASPAEKDNVPDITTAQPKIDASKLLTNEELQTFLGEPLKEAVVSSRSEAGFSIAQCYFTLATPSRSVVLTVTARGDGAQSRDPREFWMEKFHQTPAEREKEGKGEEEAERPQPAPKKIEGVGEEAYWIESGQMGALYVLEGNRFIRLAVGGNADEETKIEKSAALARSVLKRL